MAEETKSTAEQTATPEAPNVDITQLQAERDRLASDLESTKKGLSSAHAKLTEKDRLLKSINIQEQLNAFDTKISMLAEMLAEQKTYDGGKPDIVEKFKKIETETKARQALTQTQQRIAEYEEKTEALGLTEGDIPYWKIKDLVVHGKFDEADKYIVSMPKTEQKPQTEKKDVKVETEEERINRMAEEKSRKYLEDNGLLKAEKAAPGGASSSFYTKDQIAQMDEATYAKNRADIQKAIDAGRIK